MTILDRYIFFNLLIITLFAVLLFSIAWIAPETMFQAIWGMSEGKFTVAQGMAYLFYQLPEVFSYCLPIAMLFASVFLFRSMSLSNELTALFASGISFKRILIPVGLVGVLITVVFVLNQEVFYPWATKQLRALNRQVQFDDDLLVNPNVTFLERSEKGQIEKFLIWLPDAEPRKNEYIVLFYRGESGIHRILTATGGYWDEGLKRWIFQDGREYWLDPEGIYRRIVHFDTRQVITSSVAPKLFSFPLGKATEYPTWQLMEYVRLLKAGGQLEDAQFFMVRLMQRFLLPLGIVVFSLLGAAIGIEHARSRRNMSLTYAALILLLYNVLIPTFTTIGSMSMLPPFVAALLPLVIASGAGLGIIKLRRVIG